jgi:DNA-directed RNA polymerase specialized sigma24 family protein
VPDALPADSLLAIQHEGRRRFLELVADLRPELHRYCARMTGSVADGEDIVQETLARAYYLLPEMNQMPVFRP